MRHKDSLFLILGVTFVCASAWLFADPPPVPAWWTDAFNGTAIINSTASDNNFGVLNQGQLKYTAYQARNYLNEKLSFVGGAGPEVELMLFGNSTVAGFSTNSTANFAPVVTGQLEYVTKVFYDRLKLLGYNTKANLIARGYPSTWAYDYPWEPFPAGPGQTGYNATIYGNWQNQQLSLTNIGQLKMAFSFDVTTLRPVAGFNAWANGYGLNITDGNLGNETPAGDGVSNWLKYQAYQNPNNYIYSAANATNLTLTVAAGNNQVGNVNDTLTGIVLHVAANGTALNNVPIQYLVMPEGGAVVIGGNSSTTGNLRTDSNGNIAMNYTLGTSPVQWIHFTAPSTNAATNAVFTLNTTSGGDEDAPNIVTTYYAPGLDDQPMDADPNRIYVIAIGDDPRIVQISWNTTNSDPTAGYYVEREEGNSGNWTSVGGPYGETSLGVYDSETGYFTINDPLTLQGGRRYLYRVTVARNSIRGASASKAYMVPLFKGIYAVTVEQDGNLPGSSSAYLASAITEGIDFSDGNTTYLTGNVNTSYSGSDANGSWSGDYWEKHVLTANLSAAYDNTLHFDDTITGHIRSDSTGLVLFEGFPVVPHITSTINITACLTGNAVSEHSLNRTWNGTLYDHYSDGSGPGNTSISGDLPSWAIISDENFAVTYSQPYTMDDLIHDVKALEVSFPDPVAEPDEEFYNASSSYGFLFLGLRQLYPDFKSYTVSRSKYMVEYYPTDSLYGDYNLHWKEITLQEPLDSSLPFPWTSNYSITNNYTLTLNGSGHSPVYTMGYTFNATTNCEVYWVNLPVAGISDTYGALDEDAAAKTPIKVSSNGSGNVYLTPISGDNNLGIETPGVANATIQWTGAGGFSLYYTTYDPDTYEYGLAQLTNNSAINFSDLSNYGSFRPMFSAGTPNGVNASVNINFYDSKGDLLNTSSFTFQNEVSPALLTVSSEEVAGAEYRKVALNGRPLPDGKPQTASESDQPSEETFVDALTLGLRHNVTDVYEAIPGADLALSVNRVYNEEIWSDRQGLRPHEHPDEPFGAGWRTNIVATVRQESDYTYDPDFDEYFSSSDYAHVYVTDENGNEYHFLYNSNTGAYVPYPTGQHEQKPYEASLESVDSDKLKLTKKFGTTVYYDRVSSLDELYNNTDNGNLTSADRQAGSFDYTGYSYYRAEKVVGRGEVGILNYFYNHNDSLVPYVIAGSGSNISRDTGFHPFINPNPGSPVYIGNIAASSMVINIQQDENGLITDVYDSDQHQVHYEYANVTSPVGEHDFKKLTAVTTSMASGDTEVQYAYALRTEYDTTLRPHSSNSDAHYDPGTTYYHLNLSAITDQNDHTYSFDYHTHYEQGYGNHTTGFHSFNSYGSYDTPGRPLMVGNVTLPNSAVTHFYNDSLVEIDGNQTGLHLTTGSRRHTVVVDAEQNKVDYAWDAPQVMVQDVPGVVAAPNHTGELVAWGNLTITYFQGNSTTLGSESFTFDPMAGMALASVTDFSNHTTTYTHADPWEAPETYTTLLPGFYNTLTSAAFGNYSDPTSQQRHVTIGGTNTTITRNFTYNAMRLMSDVVDEEGRLTHYEFDGGDDLTLGLRTKELHYAGSTQNTTLVAETDYEYGNSTYLGIVTQKTVKELELTGNHLAGPEDLVTTYVLDESGRVAEEHVDPDGLDLVTSYTYSVAGDKLTETDPNGETTHFTYDERHRLVSVVHPDHTGRSFAYDARGNQIQETDENGNKTLREYDELNRVITETRVMTGLNAPFNVAGNLATHYTYSNTGARLSVTDPNGGVTTYEYDGLNRLLTTSSPSVITNGNSTATHVVTNFAYNTTLNCGGNAFDSSSFKPTSVSDGRGFVTNATYDELYRPITESVQYSGNASAVRTKTYDKVGNLLSVNVTVNATVSENTTYGYDALNRLIVTRFPDPSSGAANATTLTANYTSTGFKWKQVDQLGRQAGWVYDAAGRVIETIAPAPLTGNAFANTTSASIATNASATNMTYDNNGNVLTVVDARGNTTSYTYDVRNRRTVTTLPAVADWAHSGNSTAGNITTSYDAVGNVLAVTDARGNTTVTYYDEANRPTYVFTPSVAFLADDGNVSTGCLVSAKGYDKNGNLLEVHAGTASAQSPSGVAFAWRTVLNTYDALNRLTQTEDASMLKTQYAYDEAGNRIAMTDAGARTVQFGYDGLNRLTSQVDPGNRTTSYAYNAVNKISRTDATSRVTNYSYDYLNRLTGVTYVSAPNTVDNSGVSLPVYMSHGRALHYDDAGELLAVAENYSNNSTLSNIAYAYDGRGRLIAENQGAAFNGTYANGTFGALPGNLSTNSTNGITTAYTYDANGNRLTAVYASGRSDALTLTSTYDALNRLGNVTDGTRTTTHRYDLNGNRLTLIQGSNGTITTAFDGLNRAVEFTGKNAAGNHTLYDYNLTFDLFGNLRKQAETYANGSLTNRTTVMTYDFSNRLITEANTIGSGNTATKAVRNYLYDGSGNRRRELVTNAVGSGNATTVADLSFTYRDDSALLSVTGNLVDGSGTSFAVTRNYTVDANGSETQSSLPGFNDSHGGPVSRWTKFAYDYENRLVQRVTALTNTDAGAGHPQIQYYEPQVYNNVYDYRSRQLAQFSDNLTLVTNTTAHTTVSNTTNFQTHTFRVFSGGLSEREYDLGSNTAWSLNLTSATLATQYIRGSDLGGGIGGVLYTLVPSGNTTAPSYYHYDGRGDMVGQTGSNSDLTAQFAYTADGVHDPASGMYGNAVSGNSAFVKGPGAWGAMSNGSSGQKLFANTKQEEHDDNESGYVNDGFRNRDLLSGRFMTKDPSGFPDGPNPYTYANNNPWTNYDALGLLGGNNKNSSPNPVKPPPAGPDSAALQVFKGIMTTVANAVTMPEQIILSNGETTTKIANQWMKDSAAAQRNGYWGWVGGLNRFNPGVMLVNSATGQDYTTRESLNLEQRGGEFAGGVLGFMPLIKGVKSLANNALASLDAAADMNAAAKQPPAPPSGSATDTVTVYRGVDAKHPGLQEALEGKATPRGGHSDPGLHNEGNTESIFTSWTTSRGVATGKALANGPGGVVLEQTVPKSTLTESPDVFGEKEVLRTGPVEGATPTIVESK